MLSMDTSANIGFAPVAEIELGSAECEKEGTITSSPCLIPRAFIPTIIAEVAFEKANEYFLLQNFEIKLSNFLVNFFSDNHPEFMTSFRFLISFDPTEGS